MLHSPGATAPEFPKQDAPVRTFCHLHALQHPPDGLLLCSDGPDAISQLLDLLRLQNEPLQQGR